MTIRDLVEHLIAEEDKNSVIHSSIRTTRLHLRYRTWVQEYGDREVNTVTQQEVEAWLKPYARSEHRRWLVDLFRFASSLGEITTNPAYSTIQKPPKTGFLTSKVIDAG